MILKATIEAINTDLVTIRMADGQAFKAPVETLSGSPKVGAEVRILLSTGTADQPETQELARALLNELIQPSKNASA